MRRSALVALTVAFAAAVVASSAGAALFLLFRPHAAKPGDLVTVRLGGTPPGFTAKQRVEPNRQPIRLYLVSAEDAAEVRGRFDPRLSFIGRIVPDRNSRGLLRFTVPPLNTNDFVLAAWCPGCARYSAGRAFFVQSIPEVSRYRDQMGLHISMPDATHSCPVTTPNKAGSGRFNHGNGLLSSTLPRHGVVVGQVYEPDGSLFWKPYWMPHELAGVSVKVSGERLDAHAPPMQVLAVRWGSGSWATASTFPSEGCWRVTGRIGDVVLAYVVKVVRG